MSPQGEAIIDLNVRVRGNQTYVGYEDCSGCIGVGELIAVREAENGIHGWGVVTEVLPEKRIIFIALDWTTLVGPDESRFVGTRVPR